MFALEPHNSNQAYTNLNWLWGLNHKPRLLSSVPSLSSAGSFRPARRNTHTTSQIITLCTALQWEKNTTLDWTMTADKLRIHPLAPLLQGQQTPAETEQAAGVTDVLK